MSHYTWHNVTESSRITTKWETQFFSLFSCFVCYYMIRDLRMMLSLYICLFEMSISTYQTYDIYSKNSDISTSISQTYNINPKNNKRKQKHKNYNQLWNHRTSNKITGLLYDINPKNNKRKYKHQNLNKQLMRVQYANKHVTINGKR